MNIHVSNIDASLGNDDLRNLFTPFGQVDSAEISMESFTDLPRGFGYVEMPEDEQARAAIAALNGTEAAGRKLTVQEAKPKEDHKGSYKVGSGAINIYRFRKNSR
jgi:RNA recognition motif-containing protein